MKVLNKLITLFLSTFIIFAMVIPAFANDLNDTNEESIIKNSTFESESLDEVDKKEYRKDSKEKVLDEKSPLSESLESNEENTEDNPIREESSLKVIIRLHGLMGKDFDFLKVFPKSEFPKGPSISLKDRYGEEISKKYFSKEDNEIDFGEIDKKDFTISLDKIEEIENIWDSNFQKPLKTMEKITPIDEKSYYLDIYEVQNTNAIFKTVDTDGNNIENPSKILVNYKLEDKIREKENISSSKEKIKDMLFGEDFLIEDFEDGKYNGKTTPSLSLYNDENGFVSDGDYAYRILELKQKDKSNPLEVTLVRKEKVIQTENQPTFTNPLNGKKILDDDYVRVDFKREDLSNFKDSTYWVLKGVNLGNKIKPPQISKDMKERFKSWNPYFKEENQLYEENTSYKIILDDIALVDQNTYLTFAGDKVRYPILKDDFLEENKSLLAEKNENKNSDNVEIKLVDKDIEIKIDNDLGNEILKRKDKKVKREIPLSDKKIISIDIIVKNQNAKGEVKARKLSTIQNKKISKNNIIDAVKNGDFTYKKNIPEKNKTGENALDIIKDEKHVLNPKKIKSFEVKDKDYEKIDFKKIGKESVPVRITYLDNSTSLVDVDIEIEKMNVVNTGVIDRGYYYPIIFLSFGILGSFFTLSKFKRKIEND